MRLMSCLVIATISSSTGGKLPQDKSTFDPAFLRLYRGEILNATSESIFMNWGYRPVTEHELCSDDQHCQEYAHVARAASGLLGSASSLIGAWAGKDSLEVGCGRCAGSAMVATALRPRKHAALDLVPEHIDICRRRFAREAARGALAATEVVPTQGTAQRLPFADASFDYVINVESSHTHAAPYAPI